MKPSAHGACNLPGAYNPPIEALKTGFRKQWANKLRQMQVPAFASNTKGAWVLRFDDILANALELGPLQNRDFELPEETIQRITELSPKGVPVEASILLYKYYIANKEDDREYVLLPQQNFNAYFGNTNFSQKWVGALNRKLIEKKVLDGVQVSSVHVIHQTATLKPTNPKLQDNEIVDLQEKKSAAIPCKTIDFPL